MTSLAEPSSRHGAAAGPRTSRPARSRCSVLRRALRFRRRPAGTVRALAAAAVAAGALAVVAEAATTPPARAATSTAAYWLAASDGGVFAFGGAPFEGSMGGQHLNKPIVGMAGARSTPGYWLVASDGGVFAFDAPFYGSTGNLHLNRPIVGMAATPDGGGYWLVASDGGVFAFGDAAFHGSTGNLVLNRPVVGMAVDAATGGYWLVASDGGVFAFDAPFHGSTGNLDLNRPIVGMASDASGTGYTLVASDGGVFAFDAPFHGSTGGVPLKRPIVGVAEPDAGGGYWFTDSNGAVWAFGQATYWGSAPQVLDSPVVAIASTGGTGAISGSSFQSGSFGYDISNFQCGRLPPAPHAVGVVEVVGKSFGSTNPCLADEATWAGGGLNLYVFLTYGTASSSGDPACSGTASPTSCNYGFGAAQDAYQKAQTAGVDTQVTWWLDVEPAPPTTPWSTDTAANQSVVQGAIDGLRAEGLNNVGIYASPGQWNNIVGTYQPAVPYWAASWGVDPATTCASVRSLFPSARLPSGPVTLVQFGSPSYTYTAGGLDTSFDNDYAC